VIVMGLIAMGDGPGLMDAGPGLMAIGAGLAAIMGAGARAGPWLIGAGPGLLASIMTGLAADAGEASITLGGAGARVSRPTPMRAKFESSRARGQGSKCVLPEVPTP
jgi:hypothetical protein